MRERQRERERETANTAISASLSFDNYRDSTETETIGFWSATARVIADY